MNFGGLGGGFSAHSLGENDGLSVKEFGTDNIAGQLIDVEAMLGKGLGAGIKGGKSLEGGSIDGKIGLGEGKAEGQIFVDGGQNLEIKDEGKSLLGLGGGSLESSGGSFGVHNFGSGNLGGHSFGSVSYGGGNIAAHNFGTGSFSAHNLGGDSYDGSSFEYGGSSSFGKGHIEGGEAEEAHDGGEEGQEHSQVGGGHEGGEVPWGSSFHTQPQFHEITKTVPVHKTLKIPVHHPVHQTIKIPVPVKVPVPYALKIPVPVTVEKTVKVPVEKVIHYPVDKPVPFKVVKKIPVPVAKPYPVPYPVYKIRYVYHTKKIHHGHPEHHHN